MTILVKLDGGIGNQLFQLAFARSRSIQTGERTILDVSEVQRSIQRPMLPWIKEKNPYYLIPKMLNTTPRFTAWSLLNRNCRNEIAQVKVKINENSAMWLPLFMENYRQFVYEFLLEPSGYFSGTFASHHYWGANDAEYLLQWIHEDMKRFFEFNPSKAPFGIGIHARRGDYVSNPKTRAFHGYCGLEYYQHALQTLVELGFSKNGILISSDDVFFAKELYKYATKFSNRVELANSDNPYIAIMELNSCHTSIGSNSTFSFWATYLQSKQCRIFPSNWFLSSKVKFQTSSMLFGKYSTLENRLHS